MSSRYNKLNSLMHYHQQRAHYHHLLHPRQSIHRQPQQNKHQSLHHTQEIQKNVERKLQNKKMLAGLLNIYHQEGLLQKMEHKQLPKKRTLINKSKKLEADNKLNHQNTILVNKFLKVKPTVGSLEEWERHYTEHKKREKRLSKYAESTQYDPTHILYETFTSLNNQKLTQSKRKGHSQKRQNRQNLTVQPKNVNAERQKGNKVNNFVDKEQIKKLE